MRKPTLRTTVLVILVLGLMSTLVLNNTSPTWANTITLDNSGIKNVTGGTTMSGTFTHVANVLVMFSVVTRDPTSSYVIGISSITIGGSSATYLTSVTGGCSGFCQELMYYVYLPSSGSDSYTVTLDHSGNAAVVIYSFTGTKSSAPFFEDTTTSSSGAGYSSSITVAAGTSGRRVVGSTGTYDTYTGACDVGSPSDGTYINLVPETSGSGCLGTSVSYKDSSASTTLNYYVPGGDPPGASIWMQTATAILLGGATASPSDSLVQSDGVVRNFVGARAATDSGSVIDTIGRLRNVPNVLSETMGWTDTLLRLGTFTRGGGYATITRVQGPVTGTWSSGSSFTVTMGVAPTNGNTIILSVAFNINYSPVWVSSISQTGVTWSGNGNGLQVQSVLGTSDTEIWLGTVGSGAGTTITITLSNTPSVGSPPIAGVCEYSGLTSSASVLDKTATNNGDSATTDTGTTATTSQGAELWIGAIGDNTYTQSSPTNGFTLNTYYSGSYGYGFLEKIVSSTGTANSGTTLSASQYWVGAIATFKAAGSPSPMSESSSLVDAVARIRGASASRSETLTLSDLLGTRYGYIRPLIDPLAMTDALSMHGVIGRVLSDSLALTDWLPQPTYHSLHATNVYTYEFATLSDILTRQAPVVRALTDQFSLSDIFSREREVTRVMSDVLGITDSLIHIGPPAAPSSVTAVQNPSSPSTTLDLTWTETDTYAGMTYYVDKSIDTLTWVPAGTSGTTSFTASSLASGTGFYFRIRAYNGQYSAYSSTVLGVTGSSSVGPGGGGSNPPVTPSYALVIKIVDLNGTPVQGASVTLGSWSLLSDSTGIANFGTPQGGTYTISISASTCQTTNQTISLTSDHPFANPVQVSLTCGIQQTTTATTTGTQYPLSQIENNLLVPVLGISLLAIAVLALIQTRKKSNKKRRASEVR